MEDETKEPQKIKSLLGRIFSRREKQEKIYNKRHNYHVGWLSPEKNLDDLRVHLHGQWGFGKKSSGASDSDEVLSWVKPTPNQKDQYHIRVYKDGEIRGHIEGLPGAHQGVSGESIREARAEILNFLGDFATYKKKVSSLEKPKDSKDPKPEFLPEEEVSEQK